MEPIDLGPAAQLMASLVAELPDGVLDDRTPCVGYTVGDLLDHIDGLSLAFTTAATKSWDTNASGPPPLGNAAHLGEGWRTRIPRNVRALADAWRTPEAWDGTTRAGGMEMPAQIAGVVSLEELIVHGWDLARATGRPFPAQPPGLEAVHDFFAGFSGPGSEAERGTAYAPPVAVAADAPLLVRVIAMSGRDPAWATW